MCSENVTKQGTKSSKSEEPDHADDEDNSDG